MTLEEAMSRHCNELTTFEMSEISGYQTIYTIGTYRAHGKRDLCNAEGCYIPHVGEQIGYRYLVDNLFGAGAFGQVLQCRDMKENGHIVAIKLSKY